jgi:hypothetical protein
MKLEGNEIDCSAGQMPQRRASEDGLVFNECFWKGMEIVGSAGQMPQRNGFRGYL